VEPLRDQALPKKEKKPKKRRFQFIIDKFAVALISYHEQLP
jgi:hypothetical protein